MEIGIISMRYAKALMGFAKETGSEDRCYHDVSMLSRNLEAHPELREALANPILSIREKYALLCTAAVGDHAVTHELARFITLVLKNHREELMRYICLTFLHLYRMDKHIAVGKLTTAVPVSEEMAERIRHIASSVLHAHMEMVTEVDPALCGGFVFDVNDYRLDASIATQLKRVKKQFIDKNRRIV